MPRYYDAVLGEAFEAGTAFVQPQEQPKLVN